MTETIPARHMTASDASAFVALREALESDWYVCSHLAFVTDGRLAAVFVAAKRGEEDRRYYVFRAYSDVAGGGIEHHSRHEDKAEAIAARFDAASGHADLIYDNRKVALTPWPYTSPSPA